MSSDDVDDPIADALLGDCMYERLRVERLSTFGQTIDQKLRWHSVLLFALAGTLPLLSLIPPGASEFFPGSDPTGAATKAMVLGLIGGLVTFGGGLGLVYVAVRTRRIGTDLTERRARSLLTLEEMCSYLGLVTGGFAISIAVGLHLLAVGGTGATAAYVEVVGRNPFAGVGVALSSTSVAGAAAVAGLSLFLASQYFAHE